MVSGPRLAVARDEIFKGGSMVIECEKATHTNTRSGARIVDYNDKTKLEHQFHVEGHPKS